VVKSGIRIWIHSYHIRIHPYHYLPSPWAVVWRCLRSPLIDPPLVVDVSSLTIHSSQARPRSSRNASYPGSFAPPARGVVHMHSVYIYTQPISTPSPAISWHTMDLDVCISELSNSYSINTHVKWMYSYSIFDIFSIQFHICFW
jgi:hypothetical protein